MATRKRRDTGYTKETIKRAAEEFLEDGEALIGQHVRNRAGVGYKTFSSEQDGAFKFARKLGRAVPTVSEEAMKRLRRYAWPGNVRELENVIQRVAIMGRGDLVRPEHLPPYLDGSGLNAPGDTVRGTTLEDVERQAILRRERNAGPR